MGIEVRRSGDRFVTRAQGRTTFHSFSFGSHYDPRNLGFASMLAHNDEFLPPGTGYEAHRHSSTEIVTWVLEGALRHTDADGNTRVLVAGDVQRISAGEGIVHAEVTEPGMTTRFLQTWLRPDAPGGASAYAVGGGLGTDGLTEVVGPATLPVGTRGARLYVATRPGALVLPDAPQLHVFIGGGTATLGDGALNALNAGDAARLTDEGGRELYVVEPGPVAVWAFG